jgi:hypothetical protein
MSQSAPIESNIFDDRLPPGRFLHPKNGKHRLAGAGAVQGAVMKRALFWGTIVAGAVAAYLMYRRGESMGTIAVRTVTNPVGSLVSELQTTSD